MMMMSILVSNVDANADDDSIAWQSKNHMLVIPTYRRELPWVVLKRIITVIKVDADVDNFVDDDIVDMTIVGQVSIGDGYHKMRMRSNLSGLRLTLVSLIPPSLIIII